MSLLEQMRKAAKAKQSQVKVKVDDGWKWVWVSKNRPPWNAELMNHEIYYEKIKSREGLVQRVEWHYWSKNECELDADAKAEPFIYIEDLEERQKRHSLAKTCT